LARVGLERTTLTRARPARPGPSPGFRFGGDFAAVARDLVRCPDVIRRGFALADLRAISPLPSN